MYHFRDSNEFILYFHSFLDKTGLNRLRTNTKFLLENSFVSVSNSLPLKIESHAKSISDVLSYFLNIYLLKTSHFFILYIVKDLYKVS